MTQVPYRSATRVFWVFDNGSAHRGAAVRERSRRTWSTLVPVHKPIHASWLDQIEIYFFIVQRKVLTPNGLTSLIEVEDQLLRFQEHCEELATSFQWRFTRADLATLLARLDEQELVLPLAA